MITIHREKTFVRTVTVITVDLALKITTNLVTTTAETVSHKILEPEMSTIQVICIIQNFSKLNNFFNIIEKKIFIMIF